MSVPTILQNIIARKHQEVAERRPRVSLDELERLAAAAEPPRRLCQGAAEPRRSEKARR